MEISLAHGTIGGDDDVMSQTAAMTIDDVLEPMAKLVRQQRVVVAVTAEPGTAYGDELQAGRIGDMVQIITAAYQREARDAYLALCLCTLRHSQYRAVAAACSMGQIAD